MKVSSLGLTDKGKVRNENQDCFLVDEQNKTFAVADGVGGLPLGKLASEVAIETLKTNLASLSENSDYAQLFDTINNAVFQAGENSGEIEGIATTLTVVKLEEDSLLIGHVGDCAVLLFRDSDWEECTVSHTVAQEIRDTQSEEEKKTPLPKSYSHTLTRCLGQLRRVETDVARKKVQSGDRVLICSDGVTKVLDNDTLLAKVKQSGSAKHYVKTIISEVNKRGAPDNTTAIALFFD